jgi:murein DD-endopeptidase MepM/ murein hydrolase activator NlpD
MPSTFMLARSLVAAISITMLCGSPVAAEAAPTCLVPPVAAPVVDPFRAPACTWCPGNRGIDYGTPARTVVRAAGPGTVTFSGAVAGAVWVTIGHAGGLSSSYGPMAEVAVHRGDTVATGQVLGTTRGALHFGVRLHGDYIDPAGLLGRPPHIVPRLVPLHARLPPVRALHCPTRSTNPGRTRSPVR